MMHFVAGVLDGLPSIAAILLPTINSYKRLVENYWAPLTVSYGVEDRNSAIRLIKGGPSTRIEVRVPGADVNPYLAFSAIIACGLNGIKNKMQPVTGAKLPRSLAESAALMMAEGSVARKVLGDGFIDHFGATRLNEVRVWNTAVTDWELKRYMETV
jgi:glutamine synthetase